LTDSVFSVIGELPLGCSYFWGRSSRFPLIGDATFQPHATHAPKVTQGTFQSFALVVQKGGIEKLVTGDVSKDMSE